MILQVFYCVKPNTIRNIVALLFDQSKNIPMENKTQTPDKNIPTKNGMYHQMNGFQKFLMMCSGSNIHILQKSPSEWNKLCRNWRNCTFHCRFCYTFCKLCHVYGFRRCLDFGWIWDFMGTHDF